MLLRNKARLLYCVVLPYLVGEPTIEHAQLVSKLCCLQVFSFGLSRQPPNSAITRVMCCTDEERARYNQQLLEIVQTHVAPSFARNEKHNDYCEWQTQAHTGC